MAQWQCVFCSYSERSSLEPLLCERCGGTECFAVQDITDKPLIGAREALQNADFPKVSCGDSNIDALVSGGFVSSGRTGRPVGSRVMIYGGAGAGKSRIAFRWASKIGNGDIWSLEMAKELTALTAQSAGADIDSLHISETVTKPRAHTRAIVLDSLSELSDNAARETAAALLEWTKTSGGVAILIVQVTKDENYAGRGWIKHWPDYVFKVAKARKLPGHARVSLLKSRYSGLGETTVPLVMAHHQVSLPLSDEETL